MSYLVLKTDKGVFATGKVGIENMQKSIRKYVLKEIEKGEVQNFLKELPIKQIKRKNYDYKS